MTTVTQADFARIYSRQSATKQRFAWLIWGLIALFVTVSPAATNVSTRFS